MEEKKGLENNIINLYKSFDASIYKADLTRNKNDLEKKEKEIDDIVEEYAMNAYNENPNAFYDIAARIPGIGKYVKKAIVKKNGNAFSLEREKQLKKLSRMEEFLDYASATKSNAIEKINDLLDIKLYAAKQLEEGEGEAEGCVKKIVLAQNKYDSMTRREKISREVVDLQKTLIMYQNQLEESERKINKNVVVVENSEILITSYIAYSEELKKNILPASEVYNEMKFNLDNTDKIDLNISKIGEGMKVFTNGMQSENLLKKKYNDGMVKLSDITYTFVNAVNNYDGTMLNSNSLKAIAKNINDAGSVVDEMLKKKRQIAKKILYGDDKA